ncbi:DciA family protein [Corynebacterium glaucum]|uniref:DciA family protein n=1 Tax=Corynebacterium glaucum TaxID=187491 RepID=UPI000BAC185C|nr:DciA family protein [Corynebacterium glaucum]
MSDLISDTFELWRETARRRGGRLPDLSRQGTSVVPRRSVGKSAVTSSAAGESQVKVPGLALDEASISKKPQPLRGRPTGQDGRAIPRGYKVDSLGALLGREIRKRDWSENMAYGWVMGNWESLVGVKIAQHTEVKMIKEGEVHIECDSTAWATQLKYMQSTVLKAIAEKVGAGVITKLHIYGPKTKSWRKGPLHVPGRGPRDTYG